MENEFYYENKLYYYDFYRAPDGSNHELYDVIIYNEDKDRIGEFSFENSISKIEIYIEDYLNYGRNK